MKILYIIRAFYKVGGLEKIVTDKINWLHTHGYDVVLVTLSQQGHMFPFRMAPIRHIDLGLTIPPQGGKIFKLWKSLLLNNEISSVLKPLIHKETPDIVISLCSNEVGPLSAMKIQAKKIVELHNNIYMFNQLKRGSGLKGIKDRYFIAKLMRQMAEFDRLIILNKAEVDLWEMGNCMAIPNFTTLRSETHSSLNNRHAIAVGRLSIEKNYRSMLRIWRKVVDNKPDYILDIYGDGDEKDAISGYITEMGLEKNVILHGNTDNMQEAFLKADFILNTSLYEGFSLALIEAMKCGLPLLSYNNTLSVGEIIDDGVNGFIIAAGDEDTFVSKILYLINNSRIISEIGRSSLLRSQKFDIDSVMSLWTELFSQLKDSK